MKIDDHGVLKIVEPGQQAKKPKKNPVKIQDVSLRDGHLSLFGVEARTKNILKQISVMDTLGFYSIQVLAGFSPDMIQKYMDNDPWKKIQTIKKYAQKTLLSMIVSNRLPEDSDEDISLKFIEKAIESGIDIVRVLNPFNEDDRIKDAAALVKKHKKHFQATVVYNQPDRSNGQDPDHLAHYESKCAALADLGADSICILDAAGLLAPYEAYNLIRHLKELVKQPLHLHTHFTSGLADLTILKAVEAGVDIVDTCLAPFAFRHSLPAVEPLAFSLAGTSRDTGIDLESLLTVSQDMEEYTASYKHLIDSSRTSSFNPGTLSGLLSNDVAAYHELTAATISEKGVEKDILPNIPQNAESFNVFVDGEYFDVKISKSGGPRKSRIKKKDSSDVIIRERTLTSPLPGLIVELKKKVGDYVKIGESVAVLEAMKMLNRLEAKNTGIIKEIRVKEGDMVEKGDVICVIE